MTRAGSLTNSANWRAPSPATRRCGTGSSPTRANAALVYLAGPTQITLTTSWQRFKITGTLASGQTGLWVVVRQFATNSDDWTTGDIHLWGACLQQGNDPQKAYARTWASQTPHIASGLASGPTFIAAPDSTTSPFKIHGPGSNLADTTLLELAANGELILAGGSGNGYRFAGLGAASNPSGWGRRAASESARRCYPRLHPPVHKPVRR
jgi:hypothetical protein